MREGHVQYLVGVGFDKEFLKVRIRRERDENIMEVLAFLFDGSGSPAGGRRLQGSCAKAGRNKSGDGVDRELAFQRHVL
jgi:hypothetical protein